MTRKLRLPARLACRAVPLAVALLTGCGEPDTTAADLSVGDAFCQYGDLQTTTTLLCIDISDAGANCPGVVCARAQCPPPCIIHV